MESSRFCSCSCRFCACFCCRSSCLTSCCRRRRNVARALPLCHLERTTRHSAFRGLGLPERLPPIGRNVGDEGNAGWLSASLERGILRTAVEPMGEIARSLSSDSMLALSHSIAIVRGVLPDCSLTRASHVVGVAAIALLVSAHVAQLPLKASATSLVVVAVPFRNDRSVSEASAGVSSVLCTPPFLCRLSSARLTTKSSPCRQLSAPCRQLSEPTRPTCFLVNGISLQECVALSLGVQSPCHVTWPPPFAWKAASSRRISAGRCVSQRP